MRKIEKLLLVLCLIFLVIPQLIAQKEIEDKIKEMLDLMGSRKQFNMVIDQMIDIQRNSYDGILNEEYFDEFRKRAKEEGFDEISEKLMPIYTKYLTEKEIDGLIEFYKSEVGKSYIAKQPMIMKESIAIGAEWGGKMGKEIAEQLFLSSKNVELERKFITKLEEDCTRFKEGEFFYLSADNTEIEFKREGNKQIEKVNDHESEYKIEWTSNNRYLMTEVKKNNEDIPPNTLIVNIYEVEEASYRYVAKEEGEDFYLEGEVFKKN